MSRSLTISVIVIMMLAGWLATAYVKISCVPATTGTLVDQVDFADNPVLLKVEPNSAKIGSTLRITGFNLLKPNYEVIFLYPGGGYGSVSYAASSNFPWTNTTITINLGQVVTPGKVKIYLDDGDVSRIASNKLDLQILPAR